MKSRNIILPVLLCYSVFSEAQDLMKVDNSFLTNSTRYQIKSKGFSNLIPKFFFGDYSLEYAKAGWERNYSRGRGKFFYPQGAFDFTNESNQKYSYVLTGPDTNSLIANVSANRFEDIFKLQGAQTTTTKIREIRIEFFTELSLKIDSSEWQLLVKYEIGSKIPDQFQYTGTLTDGNRTIEIMPVVDHMSGFPDPRFYGTPGKHYGYQFMVGDEVVAALQIRFTSKNYVWFKNNLDPDLEFAVAGTIPSFLFMMSWMDDYWEDR